MLFYCFYTKAISHKKVSIGSNMPAANDRNPAIRPKPAMQLTYFLCLYSAIQRITHTTQ